MNRPMPNHHPLIPRSFLFPFLEMMTLDLKKSNANETVHGKLILNISTNVNAPIRNGTNTLVPGTHTVAASSSSPQPNTSTSSLSQSTSNDQRVSSSATSPSVPPAAVTTTTNPTATSATSSSRNNTHEERNDLPPG